MATSESSATAQFSKNPKGVLFNPRYYAYYMSRLRLAAGGNPPESIADKTTLKATRKAARERERQTRQFRKSRNAEIARKFYANPGMFRMGNAQSFTNLPSMSTANAQDEHFEDLALALELSYAMNLNDNQNHTTPAETNSGVGLHNPSLDLPSPSTSTDNNFPNIPCKSDRLLCVICQEEEKRIMLEPCHHVCVCEGCGERLCRMRVEEGGGLKCPLCRALVTSFVTVHI